MPKGSAGKPSSAQSRGVRRGPTPKADFATVDAETIRSAIEAAAVVGGALRFGYSRDGGAYAIGIYGDGDVPYTEWVRPSEDIEGFLKDIETLFYDIAGEIKSVSPRSKPM